MGKRADQLNVSDAPLVTKVPHGATDPRDQPWYHFIQQIDDLLNSNEYGWAAQTLEDIQRTVEKTQCVTEGQQNAIANIEAGRYKSRGRRYEGFSRSRR